MILILSSEGNGLISVDDLADECERPARVQHRPQDQASASPSTLHSAGELAPLDPEIAQLLHHFQALKARSKPLQGTRLLLARHAETAAPDRFHGAESDIGLSATGALQAKLLGESLKSVAAAAIYSSAMRRAVDTALPIALACKLVPVSIAGLHERRIGPLSGLSREEGWSVYAASKSRWIAGELDHTHEGGESYEDVRQRVVPILQALASRHLGETIIVVAHGVVIRVALTSLVAGSHPAQFERYGIDFASVNDLHFDGETWTVRSLNQVVATSPARPVG
jgi:broad specificity phosphatase PhoE